MSGPGWSGLRRSRPRRLWVRAGGRRGQQAGELADGFRVAVQAQVAGLDGVGDRALAEDHGGQGAGVGGEGRGGLFAAYLVLTPPDDLGRLVIPLSRPVAEIPVYRGDLHVTALARHTPHP